MTDLQGMAQYQALLRTRSSVLGSAVLLEIVWGEESDKELYLLLKDFVFDSGAASHGAQTSSVLRGQVSSRLPLWLRRWSDFVHQANSMVSSNPVESTRLYVRSCGFDASNWQASLNAAAVRLQLANDSDQSFQFVLPCYDIESRWHFALTLVYSQVVSSDQRLYIRALLRRTELQSVLSSWIRSRSSQDVQEGYRRSVCASSYALLAN